MVDGPPLSENRVCYVDRLPLDDHPLSPFLPSLEGARPRTPPHRTYETRRVSADGNRYQGWVSTTRRDDWIMWGLHIELSRDRSMSDETEGVRRKGCWWTAGVSRAR